MTTIKTTVSAVAMSLMVLSGVSVTGVFLSAEAAFAKSEKSNSKSSDSKGKTASKLGALNAGHASARARERASSNSRVGLIALYEKAVLAGQALAEFETTNAGFIAAMNDATFVGAYNDCQIADDVATCEAGLDATKLADYEAGITAGLDVTYGELQAAVTEAGTPEETLANAANKVTDAEVEAALRELLGLE